MIYRLPTKWQSLYLLDMFTEVENDSSRVISEVDMEMVFEKSFFVAEMVQENTGKRNTGQELVSRCSNAS